MSIEKHLMLVFHSGGTTESGSYNEGSGTSEKQCDHGQVTVTAVARTVGYQGTRT